MRVHGSLGPSGRAGGVEPEARIIRTGGRRLVGRLMGLHKGLEFDLGRVQGCGGVGHHHLQHLVVRFGHRSRQRGQHGTRHQHGLGARMLQHVGVIVGRQQRVHGHWHQSGVHGAEKAHRPIVAVMHQQQHTFFAPNAERAQASGDTPNTVFKCRVGQRAAIVDEGRLVWASGVDA